MIEESILNGKFAISVEKNLKNNFLQKCHFMEEKVFKK